MVTPARMFPFGKEIAAERMLQFHASSHGKSSPIRNLASIICQYISSKSVELEKYMRLHERMEKMLMSTSVYFLPSWSNTVAERMPPNGHTRVFIDADNGDEGLENQ
jgi:hypothetical protein